MNGPTRLAAGFSSQGFPLDENPMNSREPMNLRPAGVEKEILIDGTMSRSGNRWNREERVGRRPN